MVDFANGVYHKKPPTPSNPIIREEKEDVW